MMQFIGKNTEIVTSRNPTYRGKTGLVTNETRNMLMIGHDHRTLMIPKKSISFKIFPEGVVINGRYACLTQEERVKQFRRIERAIRKGEEL